MPKPGWTLAHGPPRAGRAGARRPRRRDARDRGRVVWEGGRLEDGHYDEFVLRFRTPDRPGETVWIPVTQTCEGGRSGGLDRGAGPGRRVTDYRRPAAALRLRPARTEEADHATPVLLAAFATAALARRGATAVAPRLRPGDDERRADGCLRRGAATGARRRSRRRCRTRRRPSGRSRSAGPPWRAPRRGRRPGNRRPDGGAARPPRRADRGARRAVAPAGGRLTARSCAPARRSWPRYAGRRRRALRTGAMAPAAVAPGPPPARAAVPVSLRGRPRPAFPRKPIEPTVNR